MLESAIYIFKWRGRVFAEVCLGAWSLVVGAGGWVGETGAEARREMLRRWANFDI